jgi:surface polysaccharide O-acyltransferase-like enzyme
MSWGIKIMADKVDLPREKIQGFDYLRAVFCLTVVVVHVSLMDPGKLGGNLADNLTNIFHYNFTLLAVPVFLQVSLFLYYKNREFKGSDYFAKSRLPSLLKPYLLWTLIFTLTKGSFQSFDFGNPKYVLLFLITGGYSIFYFFFSLLVLTACAEMMIRLFNVKTSWARYGININYLLLIASCVFILAFQVSSYRGFTEIWNPFNFMPYVFSSFIILHDFRQAPERPDLARVKLPILATAYLVLSFVEWKYLLGLPSAGVWEGLVPTYARLSLVFGAWALTYAALLYAPQAPPLVQKVSSYSMGIYCLHAFLVPVIERWIDQVWSLPGEEVVVFTIVVFLAVGLVAWLRKFKPLRAFV